MYRTLQHDTPSQTGLFGSLVRELYLGLTKGTTSPKITEARDHLLAFTHRVKPDYEAAWFHEVIAQELEQWWATPGARLILCLPPQHGKSELASRLLPAWILGKSPQTRIIASSYSDDLAAKNNLDVQRYIDSPAYADVFPGTRLAASSVGQSASRRLTRRERRTSRLFEVVGRAGSLRSAGIGAGIGGLPADVIIIDDPIKDRVEAESETTRAAVWSWYTSVALPRLRRPGKVLVMMTRWHEEDLVGHLLDSAAADPAADQWRLVRMPAQAEPASDEHPVHPKDTRPVGESLWQERYPPKELASIRATLTGYEWDGLYQQRPTRPGGSIFKREWFKVLDVMPAILPGTVRCRFWDIAATEDNPQACYTVGALLNRFPDGRIVVEDVVRGQWSPENVEAMILQTTRLDGVAVLVREEREPGASGKAVVQARARDLIGYDYKGVPSDENKVLRWRPYAAQCEAGNVYVLNRPWTKAYLDEMERAGPGAKRKDQVDASSGSFLEIAQRPRPTAIARKLAGF